MAATRRTARSSKSKTRTAKQRSTSAKKAAATRAKNRKAFEAQVIREERAAERAFQAAKRKRADAAKRAGATRSKRVAKAKERERERLKEHWENLPGRNARMYKRVGKPFEPGAVPAHLIHAYQKLVRRESGKRVSESSVLRDPRFQQLVNDLKRSRTNAPWGKRAMALAILGLRDESWMWPVGETPR